MDNANPLRRSNNNAKPPSQVSPQTTPPPTTTITSSSSPTSPTTTTRTARITSTSHARSRGNRNRHRNRNTPYLPTPTELALLAVYPALLLFGAAFAALSPAEPSYFACKDNLLNVLFVKRGWAWVTAAFALFVLTHPALRRRNGVTAAAARARAGVRWAVVTTWWVFVTQWFFGPPIIDRGFRWSGGRCEAVEGRVRGAMEAAAAAAGDGDGEGAGMREVGVKEVVTAAACKASGGSWRGGHDISGHVFLLVLGSFFLIQEVGCVAARWAQYLREERSVVMHDGAVKGAHVEAEGRDRHDDGVALSVLEALGHGGGLAAAVVGLCGWMLLMTAIYFHTWFEKFTGLVMALAGLYVTYILPRWVPALRRVVGLPGI